MMPQQEANKVLWELYKHLVTWVGHWFAPARAEEIVSKAWSLTLRDALARVETPFGPYARMFFHLERVMRYRSYDTGNIVPLGLHKMFPVPCYQDLQLFAGVYCTVGHMADSLEFGWKEYETMCAAITAMKATGEFIADTPEELGEIKSGWDMLSCLGPELDAHQESGLECNMVHAWKIVEWGKTRRWYGNVRYILPKGAQRDGQVEDHDHDRSSGECGADRGARHRAR
jgi:hypothetical protein